MAEEIRRQILERMPVRYALHKIIIHGDLTLRNRTGRDVSHEIIKWKTRT